MVLQLDYVIITHPHLDHIDDILNFEALNPKVLHRPKHLTNNEVKQNVLQKDREKFEKYCEINDRYNRQVKSDSPDYTSNPDNWGGLRVKSFNPISCNHHNFNNHSIVSIIKYADLKIVIPGDNEKCSFDELMKNADFVDSVTNADVLLAPHHGRDSGFHADFFKVVNPRLTVVSDGRFCDARANQRYSNGSRGWTVQRTSTGTERVRKCLTTASDGEVVTHFGYHSNNQRYLYVKIK